MKKIFLYLFFGPPGVGKGTLAQTCVKRFHWHHISTGSLCRKHIGEKTPLGEYIASLINKGNLVPDETMIEMVEDELQKIPDFAPAIILDGFPRTPAQAEKLHRMLISSSIHHYIPISIVFQAPDEIVIERLCKRIICSNPLCEKIYNYANAPSACEECGSSLISRVDDGKHTVLARIETYKKYYEQVIQVWRELEYQICILPAEQSSDHVLNAFSEVSLLNGPFV